MLRKETTEDPAITELKIENARLKNDLHCARRSHEALQLRHFEQTERMGRELAQARRALEAVTRHCLPDTISLSCIAQLPGGASAWKQAATALYGDDNERAASAA